MVRKRHEMMDHESDLPTSAPDSVNVTPDMVVRCTVRGDCGIVHPSFEEWQKCRTCERILWQRLAMGIVLTRHTGTEMYFCDSDLVTESGLPDWPPSRDTETKPNV